MPWWTVVLLAPLVACQQISAIPGPQCQDFASSYKLSAEQIAKAGISNITANNVEIALNFERSNWATPSVTDDPFYHLPSNINWTSSIPAGTVFAVENVTNTSLYTLPAAVSLSRIIYQTTTINGTKIPASAYVLWPYLPRTFPNITGLPVIGWGHGTSGVVSECGPSHIRNLWYQFAGPYTMALQGYVVVAPDYAGLGISTIKPAPSSASADPSSSYSSSYQKEEEEEGAASADNPNRILHPYLSNPSHALDILHGVRAAQAAFPALSAHHVVVGHSQGGGAAWSAAAAVAKAPPSAFPGYLGAVAGSPAPSGANYLALLNAPGAATLALAAYVAWGIRALYPEVAPGELFTPAGLARFELLRELGGCSSVATELFDGNASVGDTEWVRPDVAGHWAARAFAKATDYVGEDVGGAPLLVLQGTEDPVVVPAQTAESARRACGANPESAVEVVTFEGVTHVPVMYAGQRVWLDWVEDRFRGVPVEKGCRNRTLAGLRAEEGAYLKESNFVLDWVTEGYQTA
ncbi:hypothetical protein SLS55_007438 [Diplodia seriata]|uniref:AB hydrolase-1 domain-containing protein n=2 Tax=Diplodia seriata TaxID=420778 RepID=A0ABR3CCB9_9PEZI